MPRWLRVQLEIDADGRWSLCKDNQLIGKYVELNEVFFGTHSTWVKVSYEEAAAIQGWAAPGQVAVVWTTTPEEAFWAEPGLALRDARVASRIAREEDRLQRMKDGR